MKIHSQLSVSFSHASKYSEICEDLYREIFILQKEKKKLAIKAKRKKFYDDEEMEAEIKVRGRSMENEKINQQSLLACF